MYVCVCVCASVYIWGGVHVSKINFYSFFFKYYFLYQNRPEML